MLKWMKVKNLALVEEAEVEFSPGFNVLTGETGAGKSVIMGAVSLLLGARADKSAIRTGATRCEIAAEFTVPADAKQGIDAILSGAGLDSEDGIFPDTLLVRRVISAAGSRNYLNSVPVTLPVLQEIGSLMIDVHAANTAQSLMKPSAQLAVLDRFAGLGPLLEKTAAAWNALCGTRTRKEEFLASMPSAEETARMRRDAEEIRQAAPEAGEDDTLKEKHALASASRSIIEYAMRAEQALTEDERSLFQELTDIRRLLLDLERVDPVHGAKFLEQADAVAEGISELSSELASHAAAVDIDEAEFAAMEDRMRVLQTLKRRYGPTLDGVLAHLEALEGRIADYDGADHKRQEWEAAEAAALRNWRTLAGELREKRRLSAGKLTDQLAEETVKLGFKQAKFEVAFAVAPDGPDGCDRIDMRFSANPGVPLKPLREVASSGEISRVMLAVKTVLAEADAIPILVFDEIDANIGGETALMVGGELAKLAHRKQIVCISHLPQVARFAETHFLVSKQSDGDATRSSIRTLDEAGRIDEIARMFGGGTASREHAKALLSTKV